MYYEPIIKKYIVRPVHKVGVLDKALGEITPCGKYYVLPVVDFPSKPFILEPPKKRKNIINEPFVKPKCPKCGLILEDIMNYVCNNLDCPTFSQTIC